MIKSGSLISVSDYHLAGKHTNIIFVAGDCDEMRLTYNDMLFEGSALHVEQTEVGIMILAVLDEIHDESKVILSVAIPSANRPADMRSVGIHTFAVITTVRTSIAGPGLLSGQIHEYDVVMLHGNAW
jgi:predicted phosphodiesterase